jgi:hypothetical protein
MSLKKDDCACYTITGPHPEKCPPRADSCQAADAYRQLLFSSWLTLWWSPFPRASRLPCRRQLNAGHGAQSKPALVLPKSRKKAVVLGRQITSHKICYVSFRRCFWQNGAVLTLSGSVLSLQPVCGDCIVSGLRKILPHCRDSV